jgi:hypothetical protein
LEEKVTREEVLTTIREVAERLGHPPTFIELETMTPLRRRAIRKHFGSYTWALRESGLGNRYNAHLIPTDKLFTEWAGIARTLKKVPSIKEFEEASQYTIGPYPEAVSSLVKGAGGDGGLRTETCFGR